MSEPIAEFVASIPDLQSACTLAGDRSARVKLDIPQSDLMEVYKLMAFGTERALRVVIYEADVQPRGESQGTGRVRRVGAVPSE